MNNGWTFQSLIDGKMTVTAYCHDAKCGGSRILDLPLLRNRFGPDTPAMADDLIPRLKCSKCGGKRGKGVGLIYSPGENLDRVPGPPRNPYARGS